jgi:PadR family transcriptional regulator PadR
MRKLHSEVDGDLTKNEEGMCDMRGMLSFMVLWLLSGREMCGQELAHEIGKRKGEEPNAGTIYPALKELTNRGLVKAHPEGRTMVYELTDVGERSLSRSLVYFEHAFGEIFYSIPSAREKRPR